MKRNKACIIFLMLLTFSCQKIREAPLIDIKKAKFHIEKISAIADSIGYIQLETDSGCLIRNIRQLYISNDRIFVRDQQQKVFVFDLHGGFLNEIGAKGKGPGEYIYVYDFALDNERKKIYLLDVKYIREYDYSGTFTGRSFKSYGFYSFIFNRGLFYCYSPPEIPVRIKGRNMKIVIMNDAGEVIHTLLPARTVEGAMFVTPGNFYLKGRKVFFLDSQDNVFFELDSLSVKEKYVFRYGKKKKNERKSLYGKGLEVKHVFNYKTLLIFDYTLDNEWFIGLYKKSEGGIYCIGKNEKGDIGFIDDFGEGPVIYPRFFTDFGFIDVVDIRKKDVTDPVDAENPQLRLVYLKKQYCL